MNASLIKGTIFLVGLFLGLAFFIFTFAPQVSAQPVGPINLTLIEAAGDGSRLVVTGVVVVEGATITRVNWDWGDGNSNDSWFPAVHEYASDGDYVVTVTAFDDLGRSVSKTADVTVPLTLLSISIDCFPEVTGKTVHINGVVLGGGGIITRVDWDWGDGNQTNNGSFFPTHAYLSDGNYLVTGTAFDDLGRSETTQCEVEIITAVGGTTSFITGDSGSSSGSIALLYSGVVAAVAIITAGGWYIRSRNDRGGIR